MSDEPIDWKAAWYALDHDTKAEIAVLKENERKLVKALMARNGDTHDWGCKSLTWQGQSCSCGYALARATLKDLGYE